MAKNDKVLEVEVPEIDLGFVGVWAKSHAALEVKTSVSSMSFYVASHAVYTEQGAKNAEMAYLAIEKEIVAVIGKDHTKSVVTRLKRINGICYEAYKQGLKIDGSLLNFHNLEDVVSFLDRVQKFAKDGGVIKKLKADGKATKNVSLKVVQEDTISAVTSVYAKLCEELQIEQLTAKHARRYNDNVSDAMAEIKKTFIIEADVNKQFDGLMKTLGNLASNLSADQLATLMGAVKDAQATKVPANAEAPTDEAVSQKTA